MSMTISNPANPSQTYTWGQKGKRPNFITEGLANGTIKMPQEYADRKLVADNKSDEPTQKSIMDEPGLKAWKWVGVVDIDPRLNASPAKCIVVANDIREAIILLNKTMINPVTKYEFVNFWKQINNDEFSLRDNPGVYEQMRIDNTPKDIEPESVKAEIFVPEIYKEKETKASIDVIWVIRKDLHTPLVIA